VKQGLRAVFGQIEKVIAIPQVGVGGLHHRYERLAA